MTTYTVGVMLMFDEKLIEKCASDVSVKRHSYSILQSYINITAAADCYETFPVAMVVGKQIQDDKYYLHCCCMTL